LALEELAYGDAALALAVAAPLGFVKALSESGTVAQKSAYLPRFAEDAPRLAAIAHVDAGWFGGEGRPTRARRAGVSWRLQGVKALVPLAGECERFLVTALAEEGVSAFIVAADAPGVSVAAAGGTLGLRALRMADVSFADVEVAEADRLAGDISRIVDLSRVAFTAILSGLSRGVYDYVLPYTKARVVHGEAIARKQAVAFKLADMHIETQAMRWMGLRAASALDAAPNATRLASLAQRYAAEHGLRVADEGVQLFGGHGFVRDLPLEMWYRNARTLSVLDGLIGV
jgi:alkylation response protein AidB-like acyl-CoA dehydrogenase